MTLGPAPDWQHISWIVGNYNGEPILVTVDGLGQLSGGLGAISERYIETLYRISTGADVNCDALTVPVNERFIITQICVWHNDPIPRAVSVYFMESTTGHYLFSNPFLLQNEMFDRQGQWILEEDDYIRATFTTPASGKYGYLSLNGYKVEIPT